MIAHYGEIGTGTDRQGHIIEALREEVAEYGALLNCFDEQQSVILGRNAEAVSIADEKISLQLVATRDRRRHREILVAELATVSGQPAHSSLTALKPLFADPMWLLVQALIAEVNRLIALARRRAQQNQMLLARTIEVTQEIVATLRPGTVTRTYSPQGRMKIKASAGVGRLLEKS